MDEEKEIKAQNILVYTDFSEIGEKSILWARFVAKKFNKGITIIHVINENSYTYFNKTSAYSEINEVLLALSEETKRDYQIDCNYIIDQGCTCTIINSAAEKMDAFIVIMGVHKKNDLQFLSGSEAVKIIRKSRIPYLIIQKNSQVPDEEKSIYMPLDYSKEKKEQTGWVSYFAKHIDSEINIVYKDTKDYRLENNLLFCTRFFDKLNLKYNKIKLDKSTKSVNKLVFRKVTPRKCFCITIMTTKSDNTFYKIFGYPETNTITNKLGIPILCINPRKDLYIPCV